MAADSVSAAPSPITTKPLGPPAQAAPAAAVAPATSPGSAVIGPGGVTKAPPAPPEPQRAAAASPGSSTTQTAEQLARAAVHNAVTGKVSARGGVTSGVSSEHLNLFAALPKDRPPGPTVYTEQFARLSGTVEDKHGLRLDATVGVKATELLAVPGQSHLEANATADFSEAIASGPTGEARLTLHVDGLISGTIPGNPSDSEGFKETYKEGRGWVAFGGKTKLPGDIDLTANLGVGGRSSSVKASAVIAVAGLSVDRQVGPVKVDLSAKLLAAQYVDQQRQDLVPTVTAGIEGKITDTLTLRAEGGLNLSRFASVPGKDVMDVGGGLTLYGNLPGKKKP